MFRKSKPFQLYIFATITCVALAEWKCTDCNLLVWQATRRNLSSSSWKRKVYFIYARGYNFVFILFFIFALHMPRGSRSHL